MRPPYIAVTGPTTPEEVQQISNAFQQAGYDLFTTHVPMIGILVSYKTLNGQPGSRRYPTIEQLPNLVEATPTTAIPAIHYNSREQRLADQVTSIFSRLPKREIGLQLNVVWPEISQVAEIKTRNPNAIIIFQASHNMLQDPDLLKKVQAYGTTIDHVLVDPSGGKGLPFDMDKSTEIYKQLSGNTFTIGLAGGFTPDNTQERLQTLTQRIGTHFSIDAEGGLRDKITNAPQDDTLNPEKVRRYVIAASTVLK